MCSSCTTLLAFLKSAIQACIRFLSAVCKQTKKNVIDPKRCQLGTASECNHLKIITRGASQEQLQHRAHAGGRRGAQGSLRCTVAAAVQPEMVPHLLHDKDRPSGKSRAGAREYGL